MTQCATVESVRVASDGVNGSRRRRVRFQTTGELDLDAHGPTSRVARRRPRHEPTPAYPPRQARLFLRPLPSQDTLQSGPHGVTGRPCDLEPALDDQPAMAVFGTEAPEAAKKRALDGADVAAKA